MPWPRAWPGRASTPPSSRPISSKGTVYVRNGGDYVNKMLELAGGTYPFAELEPGQGGNTKMTVEEFYQGGGGRRDPDL